MPWHIQFDVHKLEANERNATLAGLKLFSQPIEKPPNFEKIIFATTLAISMCWNIGGKSTYASPKLETESNR